MSPQNHNLKIVAIIPARMGSSRFPGKPLAPILGLPMIEHVYQRVSMCTMVEAIYVATCDPEICEVVESFGGQVIMTSALHERASDRVAEAVQGVNADIVVMVQGDEPMVHPSMIEQAVVPMLDDSRVQCVNLVAPLKDHEAYQDPNIIKVVMDRHSDALYFSRESIPTSCLIGLEHIPVFKQVCIIPFRRDLLLTYSKLEPAPLEQAESIDMLRLLEYGYKVRLAMTEFETCAVDTTEDLLKVEEQMRRDPLTSQYM